MFGSDGLAGSARSLASPPVLTQDSSLSEARWWFSRHLETAGRSRNTIAAYINDLAILQAQLGDIPIADIDEQGVGAYLGSAREKSTCKRRLTSAREFFGYLIGDARALVEDPTDPFFPERIHLKTPIPLFRTEREDLLRAAREDSPRSYLMIYLLLELGLNRSEVINLCRQHIDLTTPAEPLVYVKYDDPRWRHKERVLRADARLTEALAAYETPERTDRLFDMLPQLVNSAVARVARKAGLKRSVTPQVLRDTFGIEQARAGRSTEELLAILGLAADPRNKDSVGRYIKLAQPPAEGLHDER